MSESVKYLGKQQHEAIDTLDVVSAPAPGVVVKLICSEFTSHCPVTKQPDFAHLVIEYEARESIVETKSLKLWLWRWRGRADFNEKIVVDIARAFFTQVQPAWVTVRGDFNTRGGIAVSPTFTVRA